MRPAYLRVDLDAIRGNISAIKQLIGSATSIAPVVKANAYGHGAVQVARACIEADAEMLCVAIPDEGVNLREAGIDTPILVLGPPDRDDLQPYFDHNLVATVSDTCHAAMLAESARSCGRNASIHVKLDTGMGRHGATPDVVAELAQMVAEEPLLRVEGVFSHLADGCDRDGTWNHHQLRQFRAMVPEFGPLAGDPLLHIAASVGIVRMEESHFDMVRPGTLLYGVNSGYDEELMPEGIRPALSLICRVATIKRIAAGQPVGYGCTWRAPRDSQIAVLPLGYADGYARALSNEADVLIGGRRCPVVGRVSMDAITVDVTDLDSVAVGDETVLIGAQGEERVTVEELAERSQSIVEETLARLTCRLPRIYIGRRDD